MSTPTPRTDDEESRFDYSIIPHERHYAVNASFARQLERELEEARHQMATFGIVELAIRNPNVSSYIAHWEGRTLKAESQLTSHKAALEKARVALRPLAKIADAWNDDGLDESRPYWGHTKENAASIEIVSGRGGKQLLTIGDSFIADEALTAINELNKLQQPTLL